MAKITASAAAVSHAIAYYDEMMSNAGLDNSEHRDVVRSIHTLRDLRKHMATNRYGDRVMEFYAAMVKVCAMRLARGAEFVDHSGTECRGWYRVWGAIKQHTNYFCQYDLGRDQGMATAFYEAGAISDEEFNAYRTQMTVHMMGAKRFQTNGFPDPAKIRGYWREEYQEQVLDQRLIKMLETV
jgi:hypothetical protein